MRILIKNCSITDAVYDYEGINDIYIVDGIISRIAKKVEEPADTVVDGRGLAAMPGFIDMHTHLRQPGFEHKETVASGTAAAAKGGYTTICCMPNTNPVIDSTDTLDMLNGIIAKDAVINVHPIAAVSKGEKSTELTDMVALRQKGAIAFSDDGQPVKDSRLMLEALKLAKKEDMVIIDHCEDMNLAEGGAINEGIVARRLGIKGIPALSEELPVMRDVMLAESLEAGIHIAHISTVGSADIIRKAKSRGVKVTCEVTPHHIGLTEAIITDGYTYCKVNPPLRTAKDTDALKKALADGTIDVIATDHAPHHADDKGADFYTAANGISGIETAFSVCYTELVKRNVLSLKQLVEKMSYNPARLLKLDRGTIKEGKAADIVLADLNSTRTINRAGMISKGKNTPFHGRSYTGEIKVTIANGKIVYISYIS